MKTSSTCSILIWINASHAKNNVTEIFARVAVNQKRTNISLKRKIDINSWDKNKSRAKGNSQQARLLNQYLDQVKAKLVQTHQILSNQNKLITAQLIKAAYLGEDETHKSLKEIITYHSNKIKNTLTPITIRNFGITENYITKFLEQKRKTTVI